VDKQWRCSATDRAAGFGQSSQSHTGEIEMARGRAGRRCDLHTNFEPRLILPKACLPTSYAARITKSPRKQHPYRPITARIRILALHVPTLKYLRGLLLAPPLPRFSSAIHRPRMSDSASNFHDQVPRTACWEVTRLSDASPLTERLIG
jgi:hypothetical protein